MLDEFAEFATRRRILTRQDSVKIKSEALADGQMAGREKTAAGRVETVVPKAGKAVLPAPLPFPIVRARLH
jgi:hypothetical protein